MALHDALTGLGNRAAFMEHQTRPLPPGAALFLIDLDHFKAVNDRHGHAVGDAWLVEVARRLREMVRREDVVARIGGDEFAIVPAGRMTAAAVDELARRLVARLAAPFSVGPLEIQVGASVGAARVPDSRGKEAGFELFAAADRALYDAKTGGRRRYRSATLDACERSRQRRRRA
jgi:diguanylate cyclase (GGDEF)-like protein